MRRFLVVETPENVGVEYELAGLGSRYAALVLDTLLQGAVLLLIYLGMLAWGLDYASPDSLSSAAAAAGIMAAFIVLFGYFIFFEMVSNGQTPGKKVMKLRTMRQDGGPVGFFDSLMRNVMRIADALPGMYLAGAISILATEKYRRLGDIAAGTVVVKFGKSVKGTDISLNAAANGHLFAEGLSGGSVNMYPVDALEYGILKEFLARRDSLGERRRTFEYHLNAYFSRKFGMNPVEDPCRFFAGIIGANTGTADRDEFLLENGIHQTNDGQDAYSM